MLATITCPACQHRSSIPEGDMGKRQVCSNCQSPFFAGTLNTEPQAAGQPLPAPAYNRTMLANTGPMIKFNCPRCQAPLEVPSIEARLKKPCPSCGQRLQVPDAPAPVSAPVAAQPNLNKTMMAVDDRAPAAPPIKYNCPSCKKPLESPASEAGVKKPCPACSQRMQVPAASPGPLQPNPNKTMLATDASRPQAFGSPQPYGGQPGYAAPTAPGAPASPLGGQIMIGSVAIPTRTFAIAAVAVVLLLLIVPAVLRGGKTEDAVAAAALKRDIEKANDDVAQKQARVNEMREHASEVQAKLQRLLDDMRENHRAELRGISDQKLKAELQDKQAADKAKLEQEKHEMEKIEQKRLAEAKVEAEKAKEKQQIIIQQPAPVYYYPPYHWRYYYPW